MPGPLNVADFSISPTAYLFQGAEHGSSVSFFLTHHPPGEGPPLHRHPYDETFLVLEGQVTFSVDGEDVIAGPGQIALVPAGAVHGFKNTGEGVLRVVGIHPRGRVEQEWIER